MKTAAKSDQSLRNQNFRRSFTHSFAVFLGFSILYTVFFSPVLFANKLLGPADGISYYLPAFYSAKTLWTDLIFGGYPLAADLQNMTWYPPALLLSLIPNSWNAFVILGYVLAGSFAYCYTYTLTASKLAATVTGLVYSMSGFMIGHLPMAGMVHAAAWMPLLVCAFEKLRHRFERQWFAIGGLAIACCFLAGHPQISAYGIGMGLLYALFLGWSAPIGRWKYYGFALGMLGMGMGLCAIQLLPTIELSRLSLRAEMPFEKFITLSVPFWQSLQVFFPFLFGGYTGLSTTYSPYWGEWNLAELNGYVGLLPLMLAGIGGIAYRNRAVALFWLCVGLITLLLTFGDDLFLGKLLYQVPIYNKFRGQARHCVEVALAVSVLAGLGVNSIQQRWVSKRLIRNTLAASSLLMLISLISMVIFYNFFQVKFPHVLLSTLNLLPWFNPGVGIPLVIFVLGALTLIIWSRWWQSRWSAMALLTVVILDMSSLGTYWDDWRMFAPLTKQLEPSLAIKTYRDSLNRTHQRFLPTDGGNTWEPEAIFPNLTRLWGLPTVAGYSSLMLSRVSEMMQMSAAGALFKMPVKTSDRGLDLMSVRYLFVPRPDRAEHQGLVWANNALGLSVGSAICGSAEIPPSVRFNLPTIPLKATEIGLVSSMTCSVEIPDQAEVAQIRLIDAQGQVETQSLRAGRDTAEHAYDCPEVQPKMKHQRAKLFRSSTLSRPVGGNCQIHDYVSTLKLNQPQQISQIELKWTNFPGSIAIHQISLIDHRQNLSTPLTQIGPSTQWKAVDQINGGTVYENQRVLPRAWLVSETTYLRPEEILMAIRTSQLPDGRGYEPEQMALVEDNAAQLKSSVLQPTDSASILKMADTQVEIQTQASSPAFLVLSDVNYPGWKATIDGQATPIFQTNYVQRGVKLPAGKHSVRFEFQPLSFQIGAGITIASIIASSYGLLRRKRVSI